LIVLGSALIQAGARQIFLNALGAARADDPARAAAAVFDHFQRLSPSFHDKYTSGRVISRLTSDVDVIDEMLETGFDGLVNRIADPGRYCDPAADAGSQARRARVAVVPGAVPADRVVPPPVGCRLPADARGRKYW